MFVIMFVNICVDRFVMLASVFLIVSQFVCGFVCHCVTTVGKPRCDDQDQINTLTTTTTNLCTNVQKGRRFFLKGGGGGVGVEFITFDVSN